MADRLDLDMLEEQVEQLYRQLSFGYPPELRIFFPPELIQALRQLVKMARAHQASEDNRDWE